MVDAIIKPKPARRHHCSYCGEDMGEWDRRYCDAADTCGKAECNRWARDNAQAKREEAHEQLDIDMRW